MKQQDAGPGVPDALPRALREVRERLGAGAVDRVWIFPPRIRGRREWGLLAVSRFETTDPEAAPSDLRHLHTVTYTARLSGDGLDFEISVTEEGRAPRDRLPRIMAGVVHRSDEEFGDDPREVEVGGDPDVFDALLAELVPTTQDPTRTIP